MALIMVIGSCKSEYCFVVDNVQDVYAKRLLCRESASAW